MTKDKLTVRGNANIFNRGFRHRVSTLRLTSFSKRISQLNKAYTRRRHIGILRRNFNDSILTRFNVTSGNRTLDFRCVRPPLRRFFFIRLRIKSTMRRRPAKTVNPFVRHRPVTHHVGLHHHHRPHEPETGRHCFFTHTLLQ